MSKLGTFAPAIWFKNKNILTKNLNNLDNLNLLLESKRYDILLNLVGKKEIIIDDNSKLLFFLKIVSICQSKDKLKLLLNKNKIENDASSILIEYNNLLKLTKYELWKNKDFFSILDLLDQGKINKAYLKIPLNLFSKYKKELMTFEVNFLFKLFLLLKLFILKFCFSCLYFFLFKQIYLNNVKIVSIGRFPRLADVVDKLDPLVRSLKYNKINFKKISVTPFTGYPNSKLIEKYSKFFVFCEITGPINKKVWNIFLKIGLLTSQIEAIYADYRNFRDIMIKKKNILFFEKKEIISFEKRLNEFNLDANKPFVLFGLRDMAYYKYYSSLDNINFKKTNRFDTSHRCPDIRNYYDLFKELKSKNYETLRMGLKVSQDLEKRMKNYIYDYASSNRDDALDIYLFSKCKMVIAGDTGLFSGAAAFNKPALITDLFLIRNNIYSTSKKIPNLFIPKLVFNKNSNKLISFNELIHFNHFFTYQNHCDKYGYKLIHNSTEEIINAFYELEKRINREYYETDEVKYLRKKFNDIYLPHQLGYNSTGVISEFFLNKYKELL